MLINLRSDVVVYRDSHEPGNSIRGTGRYSGERNGSYVGMFGWMYHVEHGIGVSKKILDKKDKYAEYSRRICCPANGEASG